MRRVRQLVAITAATGTMLALAAPAQAATTTIRQGTAAAAAYAGNVKATNLGPVSVSASIGSGSCSYSEMLGSVASDGTGLSIASARFDNGTPGGNCSGSLTSTITPQNLPWSGGNVTYQAPGGTANRNATVTIANFRVKAFINTLGGINCIYGGTITANGWNPDNPSRPVPATAEAQAGLTNATVTKVNTGSHWFCPGTAQVTGTFQLKGEQVANSGNYDQTLYVTI